MYLFGRASGIYLFGIYLLLASVWHILLRELFSFVLYRIFGPLGLGRVGSCMWHLACCMLHVSWMDIENIYSTYYTPFRSVQIGSDRFGLV
ncbi:hypothetical protein BDV95DRAFT_562304 [Massariosphaeria phaeospora]|uniref:Uncharacterized protein n=1 Tax=Massariosphaeria phaeospora TaxID=100035 RepID=A0A7C8IG98_9PLEO|nr:hypothetical protein BDV95DRAFT_562304 [Massariosphaeria phaeospora]